MTSLFKRKQGPQTTVKSPSVHPFYTTYLGLGCSGSKYSEYSSPDVLLPTHNQLLSGHPETFPSQTEHVILIPLACYQLYVLRISL